MQYQLKRIDTWSAVKFTFVVAGVVGFVVGAVYAMLISAMAGFLGMVGMAEGMPDEMGYVVGATGFIAVIAWIVITILYAVLGALVVALTTWLYNLLARAMGGVTVTLEADPAVVPAVTAAPADNTSPAAGASSATTDVSSPDHPRT